MEQVKWNTRVPQSVGWSWVCLLVAIPVQQNRADEDIKQINEKE
jgi:hypothetical protein